MITSRDMNVQQEYSRAKFRVDSDEAKQLFSNPLLFVSIYSKYHAEDSLKATVALINKRYMQDPDQFQTLDILISGTLQRHCYWALSENLTHKKIIKVLKDLPAGLSLEQLAVELAKKFLPLAKKAENKYIADNLETYVSNMPNTKVKFIPWEKMVPGIIHDKDHDYGHYEKYHQYLKARMAIDSSFVEEAFQHTSTRLLEAKNKLIIKQSKILRSLSPAMSHLSDKDLLALARICCRNFLMEEAPLLFARLGDLNYSSIIYPAALTNAFKVTQEIFSYKPQPEWVVVHIEDVKRGADYADSTEANKPTPALQRSLSLGSLTIETKPSLFHRMFFSKSKSATPVKTSNLQEEKSNIPPTPKRSIQVSPFPKDGAFNENSATPRVVTVECESSSPRPQVRR